MRKERGPVTVKTVGRYRVGDVCEMTVARLGEVGAFLDAGTGNTSGKSNTSSTGNTCRA